MNAAGCASTAARTWRDACTGLPARTETASATTCSPTTWTATSATSRSRPPGSAPKHPSTSPPPNWTSHSSTPTLCLVPGLRRLGQPRFFALEGNISNSIELTATTYRAQLTATPPATGPPDDPKVKSGPMPFRLRKYVTRGRSGRSQRRRSWISMQSCRITRMAGPRSENPENARA